MVFNSFSYLIFFPVVAILYFLLPHKYRWFLLLAASCYFYMFFIPVYILILFFTIIIDYFAGILIENSEGWQKSLFLKMSLVANIGILCLFKYYNFLAENINAVLGSVHVNQNIGYLKILLPIGLSFHTFQAMSYTIEVYRGNQKAERHFGIYALYVMFFPQLVAGPIERPQNVLHQFHIKHNFDIQECMLGLQQIVWGLFKKSVIADRLAIITDSVYNQPKDASALSIIVGTIFFAFEIYCDFSGYSDIALGSARVLGFKLMKNFDLPFQSKSITEFWRRWHISLSAWFNDYLFNPIVGSIRAWGNSAIAIGLLTTFFLSGLWHGAGWKFVIFGLLHGAAMVYEFYTKKLRKKLFKRVPANVNILISRLLTFLFAVFAWVFFRANNLDEAFLFIRKSFSVFSEIYQLFSSRHNVLSVMKDKYFPQFSTINTTTAIVFLLFLEIVQHIGMKKNFYVSILKSPTFIQWVVYFSFILCIVVFGVFDNKQFIYFQF